MAKPKQTIGHIISGLNDGGAEAVLYRLCVSDAANTHFVVSLTDEGKYGEPLRRAGVTVHCLEMRRGLVTARGLRTLWSLLTGYRPDVVQTWMYHSDLIGGVVASMTGVKRICWGIRSGELLWTSGQRLTSLLRWANAPLSWILPSTIICCSATAARIHRSLGYCTRKIRVIPNGVDVGAFRPDAGLRASLRHEWHVLPGVPLLAAVGRFSPYKGYTDLVEALSLLKRQQIAFRCVFVGAGLDAGNRALSAQIQSAGLQEHVVLCGPRNDIPAVMNASDICVLSSLAEGFPSVLIEAMACGVPCVATDVGGAGEIVGGTGWLTPPQNPPELARMIALALLGLKDESELAARKSACRERVMRNFTLSRMVEAYAAVWHQ